MNITIRNNHDGTYYLCIADHMSKASNLAITWSEVLHILSALPEPK